VVVPYGDAFVGRELKSESVQDIYAATAVPAAITLGGLAKVVEQSYDGNAIGWEAVSVGKHMLIHFK
jgi:hypothetical protein